MEFEHVESQIGLLKIKDNRIDYLNSIFHFLMTIKLLYFVLVVLLMVMDKSVYLLLTESIQSLVTFDLLVVEAVSDVAEMNQF